MVPGKLAPGNSETKNRGVGDVINLRKPKARQRTQNSTTNPKLGNKPKTRKQKIVG